MSRSIPPLNALRAFECAARHLSFTRAAEELHVTQAAVSHQVKALESHLGVKLFRRAHRALLLTDEGQAYAPALSAAFEQIRDATRRMLAQRGSGPLTVSVLPSFAARWLVPRLGRFRQQHPDVDLLIDPTPQLADLSRVEVDVAIRYGLGRYPGLHADRLLVEDLFPVCSPLLLRGEHPLRSPQDLAFHPLLHDEGHGAWSTWLRAAGVDSVDASRGTVFTDSGMLVQAAVAGQGVALARGVLAGDELRAGALVRPFERALTTEFAYYLVCLPERANEQKIARFRAWLIEEAGANG